MNINNIQDKLKACIKRINVYFTKAKDVFINKSKEVIKKINLKCFKKMHEKVGTIFKLALKNIKSINLKEINKDKVINLFHQYKTSILRVCSIIVILSVGISILSIKKVEEKKYTITDNKAEAYYYEGNFDKAITEYESLLKQDSSKVLYLMKISEIYSVKGDIKNSEIYIDKAKKTKSKNAELLNYIVFTEFMNKNLKGALSDGETAIKLYPKNKSIIKTMFSVYMANNEIDKAKLLILGYPLDIKSAYDCAEYSRMLMLSGDFDKGLQELQFAYEKDKDEYKIYDVLSQIAVYNKDLILEKITDLSNKMPKENSYKMWLAKIYSLSPDTADMADKIMVSIKNENLGKIEVKLIQASILQNSKDTNKNKEADKLIEEVISKNKNDYRVLHTAAWYYLNKKDLVKAEKYCKESIVKNKNYTDNYGFLMPEILKAQGKSIGGEPYFRTAMYKEPYNYNIMLNVANFYWYTTKNTEKALEYFKLAELIKPEDPEIKYNMALINISNNKLDDAIPYLKACIKLSDSVPKYHRTLGTIYMNKGMNNEAISEIRYAYHADEEDVLNLNNAGAYYYLIDGNLDKGLYNLQQAYEGLSKGNYDKYTKDTITSNYNKAKEVYDKYKNGKGGESIAVPNFIFFY